MAIDHRPITERENWLGSQIVDISICVHKVLGPGLLGSIYEKCFCYELAKRGIEFQKTENRSIKVRSTCYC